MLNGAVCLGIGVIAYTGGVPAWLVQPACCTSTITDTGTGDAQITMTAGGLDATEGVILATPLGTATEVAIVHTSDTSKQIKIGATPADVNVQLAFFQKAIG